MQKYLRLATAALLLLSAPNARAATATGQFQVQLTIAASCQVTNTNTLDFGTTGGWTSAIDATATFQVQCTTGVPYSVALDAGVNPLLLLRRMKHSTDSAYVTYELYTDTGRLLPWLSVGSPLVNLVGGTGTGSPQTHTVFGRVPVQPVPGPGVYTDTITVTVTY